MPVLPPPVDRRDADAIVEEIHQLARLYTPGWESRTDTGPGGALVKVFARLLEGLVQRFNQAPNNNFLAFLNMLGAQLLPAQPARVPLTFTMSQGATDNAVIPAGTQAVANLPGLTPQVFEIERAIVATPAQLIGVYSITPHDVEKTNEGFTDKGGEVYDHGMGGLAPEPAVLWGAGNPNLQEHSLYLGHSKLFDLKDAAAITIDLVALMPDLTPDDFAHLAWEWWDGTTGTPIIGKASDGSPLPPTAAYGPPPTSGGDWKTVRVTLSKPKDLKFDKGKVQGIENIWIRAHASQLAIADQGRPGATFANLQLDTITAGVATPEAAQGQVAGIDPDALFHGDVQIVKAPFYPFGARPRLFDALYIASGDAFSKPGTPVTMTFAVKLDNDTGNPVLSGPPSGLQLSWEYWNGKGWQAIPGLKGTGTDPNATPAAAAAAAAAAEALWEVKPDASHDPPPAVIDFTVPAGIARTAVNGQDNYWIRVRIVSGDYGSEKFTPNTSTTPATIKLDLTDIHAPSVSDLKIRFGDASGAALSSLEAVLTANNLTTLDRTVAAATPGLAFAFFEALPDTHRALYLSFDRALRDGPISIFFSLVEQAYNPKNMPRIEWEYSRPVAKAGGPAAAAWARLENPQDGTRNLTESGALEFIAPADFGSALLFGKTGYWLRAVDADDRFEPGSRTAASESEKEASGLPAGTPTSFAVVPPDFSAPGTGPAALPRVRGIYVNTAWGTQGETFPEQILGSGTGLANQGDAAAAGEIPGSGTGLPTAGFALAHSPVLSEQMWINEFDTLSDAERRQVAAAMTPVGRVDERKDAQGNTQEFRVLWLPVSDLESAGPRDRVYAIDRALGRVTFGDGIHGAAPPIGQNNIIITYQAGGGEDGNVAAGLVTTLRTAIPLVAGVTNPEAAGGGSNTEVLPRALERVPASLKNGGRAVMPEDYEALALEASRAVARARCLPCLNDQGKFATGWVTVIIVPGSGDVRPAPSPRLRQNVTNRLAGCAPNVIVDPRLFRLQVVGPTYVQVTVSADVYPITMDLAPRVRAQALSDLTGFLHPLTGGYGGKGWEFGRLPCLSDFYHVLENIGGIDHVENVVMRLQAVDRTGAASGQPLDVTGDQPFDTRMPEYALIYSGEHQITVRA